MANVLLVVMVFLIVIFVSTKTKLLCVQIVVVCSILETTNVCHAHNICLNVNHVDNSVLMTQ